MLSDNAEVSLVSILHPGSNGTLDNHSHRPTFRGHPLLQGSPLPATTAQQPDGTGTTRKSARHPLRNLAQYCACAPCTVTPGRVRCDLGSPRISRGCIGHMGIGTLLGCVEIHCRGASRAG